MTAARVKAPKELIIYVDGASRGNPGPAAVGALLSTAEGDEVLAISESLGTTTNNVAEYFALIYALEEAAILGAETLSVFSDSELMVKQFNGEYKVKEETIRLLYRQVKRLAKHFKQIRIQHVPREQNKYADRLANEALDGLL